MAWNDLHAFINTVSFDLGVLLRTVVVKVMRCGRTPLQKASTELAIHRRLVCRFVPDTKVFSGPRVGTNHHAGHARFFISSVG